MGYKKNGVITTGIEINIEGNKSGDKIANHANEIKNIFSHEEKHNNDFIELGFNGYFNMSDNQKESRAVQTQMNQSTFKDMRPIIQQKVIEYGIRFGMIYPINIPVQGIQLSNIQSSK